MTRGVKPVVVGNWKMNGLVASMNELAKMKVGYTGELRDKLDLALCVPATLLAASANLAVGSGILIGGQDCHIEESGAHTGDISAEMLFDAGAKVVIVGHSERRTDHGETSAMVKAKAEAGLRAAMVAIVCIGETEFERKSGKTLDVLCEQLAGSMPDAAAPRTVIVAYEPVWAIGTGMVPSNKDVAEAHAFIRKTLIDRFGDEGAEMRVLYGGSVKPSNAKSLMGILNVDGVLVGGASLTASDFLGICAASVTTLS